MRFILLLAVALFLLPALARADNISYEEAWPVKGNVAMAGPAFVVVQSEKNEVGHWTGKDSKQPETVMTDGVHVSKNLADLDESKLTIIMFSPKEIRVLDLEANRSYKYSRNPEDRIDPNKLTPAQGAALGKWFNGGEKGADGKPIPYPVTVEQIEKAEQPTPAPAAATPIECQDTTSGLELRQFAGKMVTLHGQFELTGKEGPFINCNGEGIYLISKAPYTWGSEWGQLQGKVVNITGVLRFRHYKHVKTALAEQVPPDYYYLDQETAKIHLGEKAWQPTPAPAAAPPDTKPKSTP